MDSDPRARRMRHRKPLGIQVRWREERSRVNWWPPPPPHQGMRCSPAPAHLARGCLSTRTEHCYTLHFITLRTGRRELALRHR